MKKLFYSLSIIIIFTGCKPAQPTTENISSNKRYAVGQGGGFTGDYTEFILEENGKVYRYDFKYDREVYIKDLEKVDLHYFLERITELGLEGIEINQPGNMSYYIDIRIGKVSYNKIIWGANLYYPPQELVDFHKELYKQLAEIE